MGETIYNTTTDFLNYYDGSTWQQIDTAAEPDPSSLQQVTDVGATTDKTITLSPTGNDVALIANGSGTGDAIQINHDGTGTGLIS